MVEGKVEQKEGANDTYVVSFNVGSDKSKKYRKEIAERFAELLIKACIILKRPVEDIIVNPNRNGNFTVHVSNILPKGLIEEILRKMEPHSKKTKKPRKKYVKYIK